MSQMEQADVLLQRWKKLLEDKPGTRARNAAAHLNVSEGELVAARCGGDGATRLTTDFRELLKSLEKVGEVLTITRNEYAVHEKTGFYRKLNLGEKLGTALDSNIDLRYNFHHWAHAFAVVDTGPGGTRESIQFFDRDGTSVHKIYPTDNADDRAWRNILTRFSDNDQTPGMTPEPARQDFETVPLDRIDSDGLRESWLALTDVHGFQPLLHKFKASRLNALRSAGTDLARQVDADAWRSVLQYAVDTKLSIMVFVGSPGVVQIHTGPVQKLLIRDGWYNILDPDFNLHFRESAVGEVWINYRPTNDGGVTSLEVYDHDDHLIMQLFGARKPGVPELKRWRALLADIPNAGGAVARAM